MNPMRTAFLSSIALFALLSCGGGPTSGRVTAEVRDTNWMGEARITAGDTIIRLCGSGKRYRITGSASDSLAGRYRFFSAKHGQWMKVWLMGHLGTTQAHGVADSALVMSRLLHIDGSVHCDPIPDPRLAGVYAIAFRDMGGERTTEFSLLPEGYCTMYTDFHHGALPVEEDGTWGRDADDHLVMVWPRRSSNMRFSVQTDRLVSDAPTPGAPPEILRTGPPDRLKGAFGRTALWLATVTARQGHPMDLGILRPWTPLSMIFPTANDRDAATALMKDTLNMSDDASLRRWQNATTFEEAVAFMRDHPPLKR